MRAISTTFPNPGALGTSADAASEAPSGWPSRDRLVRGPVRLLRYPLRHKLVLAHAAILLAVAGAAGALGFGYATSEALTAPLFLLWGTFTVGLSLVLHMVVVRAALAPLVALERAAERVERGDFSARADVSPLADANMVRVVGEFNRLLDGIAGERRRLRSVAAHAFRAQEAERMRIARELQEDWAQRLAATQMRLRAIRRSDDPEARERVLDELRGDLAETTESLRTFARGLHPPSLRELGPTAAIRSLARSVEKAGQVRVALESEGIRGLLSSDQELALFRIVQEALTNAVRHASASTVEIQLHRSGPLVEVEVWDDGVGFDATEMWRERPCLGLFGMQERALYAGGTVTVLSRPGAGTRIRLRLPIEREEEDPSPPQPDARWVME